VMKKFLCLMLCLMLMLPAAQAKTFDYTIAELIVHQIENKSSLRVSVSAAAAGEAPGGMDAAAWQEICEKLPELQLNGTYFWNKSRTERGDEQAVLTLLAGEDVLSTLMATGKGGQWLLDSDLLPGKTLAFSRNLQDAYMTFTHPQENQWPDMLRMLLQLEDADDAVSQQLENALSPHMALLNEWLQRHTRVDIMPDANGVRMRQTIVIPAAQVKEQIKALLSSIYQDEALLALLRAHVSQPEAYAYLEPGMLPLFEMVIDQAALEGEMRIVRAYDAQGLLEGEEISMPFIAALGLRQADVSWQKKDGVNDFSLRIVLPDGMQLGFASKGAVQTGSGEYQGKISVMPAGSEKPFEALYTLSFALGMETYDEEKKPRERQQRLSAELKVEPGEGTQFNAQAMRLEALLQGSNDSTRPSYIDATLSCSDETAGTQVLLTINGKTSSPLRITETDSTEAIVLDKLGAAEIVPVLTDVFQQLSSSYEALIARIAGTETVH